MAAFTQFKFLDLSIYVYQIAYASLISTINSMTYKAQNYSGKLFV